MIIQDMFGYTFFKTKAKFLKNSWSGNPWWRNPVVKKIKTLHSDNGGKYTSKEFEDYLKKNGIRHERTVPKTPEQNKVADRINRTLVETVRAMLSDSKLP